MRRLIVWLTNTKVWSWLLLKVVPFIRFTTYYTSLRGDKYTLGYEHLRACDIILTKDKKKLTTVLIGGEFTHAALFLNKSKYKHALKYEIAEMTHHGYTKSWFFDICKESDRVVILRCKDLTLGDTIKIVKRCTSFENANYDVKFDLGVNALYCSELIEKSFGGLLDVNYDDIKGLGTKYISPTGLYNAKNCAVIWDSDKPRG